MKTLHCSNCGMTLNYFRKAMPGHGTIIDLVDQHECLKETIEPNLKPIERSAFEPENNDNKFVQKLNDLSDRRPTDQVKKEAVVSSTAPQAILNQLDDMLPSELPSNKSIKDPDV